MEYIYGNSNSKKRLWRNYKHFNLCFYGYKLYNNFKDIFNKKDHYYYDYYMLLAFLHRFWDFYLFSVRVSYKNMQHLLKSLIFRYNIFFLLRFALVLTMMVFFQLCTYFILFYF